jgi:hypothetical protein
LWQSNDVHAVTLASTAKPSVARIIYGLDADAGMVGVAMSHYDPITGNAGDCDRDDRTQAISPEGSRGTTYFAFDAPAGEYLVTFTNSTGRLKTSSGTGHFLAPAGRSVYVGTFFNDGPPDFNRQVPISLKRDLIVAKQALGSAGRDMVLADELGPPAHVGAFMCTF